MFDILKWLDDAPIKLVAGVGDPESGGCWMSALSIYAGSDWSDHPPCVCHVIRRLCIAINDMLPSDDSRGRVIQPHILDPVGTATEDDSVIEARLWHLINAAAKRFVPFVMESGGLHDLAASLRNMPKLTPENWSLAQGELRAAAAAAADDDAVFASHVARAATRAADAFYVAADIASHVAAYAADYAADHAIHDRANAAREAFGRDVVMPVILELCQIGSKIPVEPSCDELAMRRVTQTV